MSQLIDLRHSHAPEIGHRRREPVGVLLGIEDYDTVLRHGLIIRRHLADDLVAFADRLDREALLLKERLGVPDRAADKIRRVGVEQLHLAVGVFTLDAHVFKRFLDHLSRNGGAYLTAVYLTDGVVDNYKNGYLGVIRRRKAAEGRNIVSDIIELLRCAGLARDPVARDVGVFACAARDDLLHHARDYIRRLL